MGQPMHRLSHSPLAEAESGGRRGNSRGGLGETYIQAVFGLMQAFQGRILDVWKIMSMRAERNGRDRSRMPTVPVFAA